MENQNTQSPAEQAPDTTIMAYVMKTKQKSVMQNPVITRTSRGYMAQGTDELGNKCITMMNGTRALACIEAGTATKGDGWE